MKNLKIEDILKVTNGELIVGDLEFECNNYSTDTRTIKENDVYIVKGDQIEKLFRMTKFTTEEGILRFTRRLRKMGVDDKLEELGAQEGDIVRILDFEFEYRN